ncbi:MAG: PEGA domain-containing protein [bacterium]
MKPSRTASRFLVVGWALLFLVSTLNTADARRRKRRRRVKRPPPVRPVPRTPPVDPKRAEANILLKGGSEKMELGLYADALSKFTAAYKLVPSPKIFYNIALTYNYLTRYVEALQNFESFVREFKDHTHKYWQAANTVWIPRLRKKIATVQVRVNVPGASVTVAGQDAGTSPNTKIIRIQPEPGRHFVIVVSKASYVEKTLKVNLKAGQNLVQEVRLVTEAKALAMRKEFQREQAERRRIQERLQREQRAAREGRIKRRKQLRLAGWATLGAGLAIALAGGVVGIVSLTDKFYVEGAEEGSPFSDYQSRYDRSITLGKVAWAGIGSGLAIAAAGGIIVWLSYRKNEAARTHPASTRKPTVSILPVLGPQQAGLTLKLQF